MIKKYFSTIKIIGLLGIILCMSVFFAITKQVDISNRGYDKHRNIAKPRVDEDVNQYLIFIGGVPRSGTTLMRRMLESHPDIRCGPETHIIPLLLRDHQGWVGNSKEYIRLMEAGVAPRALDMAIAKFILSIIVHHGSSANYYCNKDPYVLSYTKYLREIYPNSKYILMLRDGRASVHSIVSRGVTIDQWDITNYRKSLKSWNREIEDMYTKCLTVGRKTCLPVKYEELVLQPVATTKQIFNFLEIPWNKEVLHHEKHVNETKLSSVEMSTDQVKKPLYLNALSSWFGHIPADVERDMSNIAPMLKILGYNPEDKRPSYGEPDDFILKQLQLE